MGRWFLMLLLKFCIYNPHSSSARNNHDCLEVCGKSLKFAEELETNHEGYPAADQAETMAEECVCAGADVFWRRTD